MRTPGSSPSEQRERARFRVGERRKARKRRPGSVLRFFFFSVLLGGLGLVGLIMVAVFGTVATVGPDVIGPGSPQLNPLEALALRLLLAANRKSLLTPAGGEPAAVPFEVSPGETAAGVAARLESQGLTHSGDLLRYYMRYNALDADIEAGNFSLSARMTIPEIAEALTEALPQEVSVHIWEGWRSEQIAEAFGALGQLDVDASEFLRQVRGAQGRPGSYSFLGDIPATATLEGFLFPDTYRFLPGATAAEVLDRMLATFDERVTTDLRVEAAARGLTLYEVVTLASIVEREAVHDDERPLIAAVFLNRLDRGMPLDADPTTQYALARPGDWWPKIVQDPRLVNDPYNTYNIAGLPPGPIANPGLASIRAVVYPAEVEYLFFRAACDGSGWHNFSHTYEEHLEHGCQ